MEPEVIFQKMNDKSRCLVMHYFYPAERNILVEIVPGKDTDPALTKYLMKLYEFIGKAPIKVKSRYGYAVDPIFEGLFEATALTVEKGLAPVKQEDAIVPKALSMGAGPFTAHNLAGGNPNTQHGLNEMHTKIMPWYRSPKILDDQVKSGKPWETAEKGEKVEYTHETHEAVSNRVIGAYFGMICEIVGSGISNIGDLELAMDVELVLNTPFAMMNKMGVKKALELVKAYAKENAGFKVDEILVKQAASGQPWKIPVVFREDKGERAVLEGAKMTLEEGLKSEAKIFGECLFTQDMKIGIENFLKDGPKVNANFVHN